MFSISDCLEILKNIAFDNFLNKYVTIMYTQRESKILILSVKFSMYTKLNLEHLSRK